MDDRFLRAAPGIARVYLRALEKLSLNYELDEVGPVDNRPS